MSDWTEQALCAQVEADPEFWFPIAGPQGSIKAICNGGADRAPCPVRGECLGFALEHHEPFGIWGGLNERERRGLLRAEGAA